MMKKQIIIVGIVVLVLAVVGLTGCFGNNDNGNGGKGDTSTFYGTWEIQSYTVDGNPQQLSGTVEFKSDGTSSGIINGEIESGTWRVKDGKYCGTVSSSSEEDCYDYSFSNGDSTLTFTYNVEDEQGVTHTAKIILTKQDGSNNDGNGGTLDSRFVGEWKDEYGEGMIFNSNGSWYVINNDIDYYEYRGTWREMDNQICFRAEGYSEYCYGVEFSNNDETLTIHYHENSSAIYTKQ